MSPYSPETLEEWRTYPCAGCGLPQDVQVKRAKYRHKRPIMCAECASDRVADNARQISARSGPYYDRWVTAMRRTAERL